MNFSLERSIAFLLLATATVVVAYLYQRNARVQRIRAVWMFPAIFTLLAAHAVLRDLPRDPGEATWLLVAFPLGIAIGIARGVAFGVEPGANPGEMILRPNLISGAIYLAVLFVNEFVRIFYFRDELLRDFSCAFLVLSAGNSIAVNLTRLIRYRAIAARAPE